MLARNPEQGMAPSEVGDVDLVSRIAGREESALGLLYARHSSVLFSLACQMLGDPMEAEEVLQDTFLRAWRHASKYDESRATVFTWLVMITRRQCLDRLRARRNNPLRSSQSHTAHDAAEEADSRAQDPRLRTELGESIAHKLAIPPDSQRACIELAYFQGLTQFEIAEQLGEPLGTVKARIRRGLRKLRNLLHPTHD